MNYNSICISFLIYNDYNVNVYSNAQNVYSNVYSNVKKYMCFPVVCLIFYSLFSVYMDIQDLLL